MALHLSKKYGITCFNTVNQLPQAHMEGAFIHFSWRKLVVSEIWINVNFKTCQESKAVLSFNW